MGESSAGVELGFNKEPPQPKTGVASCSSFTWAMDPVTWRERVQAVAEASGHWTGPLPEALRVIENEYGDLFTIAEFEAVLSACPIQYTHLVGEVFA